MQLEQTKYSSVGLWEIKRVIVNLCACVFLWDIQECSSDCVWILDGQWTLFSTESKTWHRYK